MTLPKMLANQVADAITEFHKSERFDFHPRQRLEIYRSLGQSGVPNIRKRHELIEKKVLPDLTIGDHARYHIAYLSAKKVSGLWNVACHESDLNFGEMDDERQVESEKEEYLNRRRTEPIEMIWVYQVPRQFCPFHILEMAEVAYTNQIQNISEFLDQANEWWQIYPRPENMEREFLIKWAAQEALYELVGLHEHIEDNFHIFDLRTDGLTLERKSILANWKGIAPCGRAALAYAGIFENGITELNYTKWREFWLWWLEVAIPQAWTSASTTD